MMTKTNCLNCGKEFMLLRKSDVRKHCSRKCFGQRNRPKGTTPWNKGMKGVHFSPASEFKKGITPKNSMVFVKTETQFKGTISEYKALHHKIGKLFGKPKECEQCGISHDNPKKIHWACVTGEYNQNRENWKRLCAKCHHYFDRHNERKVRYQETVNL